MARKKVTIVGGGQTGGIMAYRLAEKNICDIVIKDVAEYAQHHGKALDIMQGGPFGNVLDDDVADVLLCQAVGHDAPGLAAADDGYFLARHANCSSRSRSR